MASITRHLLLRWVISSSDDMVADRLGTREMTVPTRNRVMPVVAEGVMARDQAVTTREILAISVPRAILKLSVGRSILDQGRTKAEH